MNETDKPKNEGDNADDQAIATDIGPACSISAPHDRHPIGHGPTPATCPGVEDTDDLGSYAGMFAEYLEAQKLWLDPTGPQAPLIFHIRKLCRRLDTDVEAPASMSSAYLQAISRLDKQRPGSVAPGAGQLPGQRSIFDELDD